MDNNRISNGLLTQFSIRILQILDEENYKKVNREKIDEIIKEGDIFNWIDSNLDSSYELAKEFTDEDKEKLKWALKDIQDHLVGFGNNHFGTEDCGLSTILFYTNKLLERHNFFINLEEVEEE